MKETNWKENHFIYRNEITLTFYGYIIIIKMSSVTHLEKKNRIVTFSSSCLGRFDDFCTNLKNQGHWVLSISNVLNPVIEKSWNFRKLDTCSSWNTESYIISKDYRMHKLIFTFVDLIARIKTVYYCIAPFARISGHQ